MMVYGLGTIGASEGMALIVMLLLPNIYLSEPSVVIGYAGSSAWLMKVISAAVTTWMLLTVLRYYDSYARAHGGGSFYDFLQYCMGKRAAMALFMVWAVLFELQSMLTLREFADHVLTTALSEGAFAVVIILLGVCISGILFQGLEVLLRTAYIFTVISAVALVLVMLGLSNIYEPANLFPWLGYGLDKTVGWSAADLGTWSMAVAVLLIAPNLQNRPTVKRAIYYGMGCTLALKLIVIVSALLVFGPIIAPERALLFYEIVRTIHMSQYIQRVDSIFVVVWLTAGIVSTVLVQYFAIALWGESFNLRDIKPLILPVTLLTTAAAALPDSIVMVIKLNNIFMFYIGSVCTVLSFVLICWTYYRRSGRNDHAAEL